MSIRLGQLCAYLALVSIGAGAFGAMVALDAYPFFLGSAGFYALLGVPFPGTTRVGLMMWGASQAVMAFRFWADSAAAGSISALMMVTATIVLLSSVFRSGADEAAAQPDGEPARVRA